MCFQTYQQGYTCLLECKHGDSVFVNTLRLRQNVLHFPDNIFKCIFVNENVWIAIKISLKFDPKVRINNIPVLVQVMAWRRPGDTPLSEPMMVSLLTHICVTRPQWVKQQIDVYIATDDQVNDTHALSPIYLVMPLVICDTAFTWQLRDFLLNHWKIPQAVLHVNAISHISGRMLKWKIKEKQYWHWVLKKHSLSWQMTYGADAITL